ncbi:cytochrome c biogenesis protein CcsA [filamentous cyanobacterium LEGE 11480]|uniref:Cytochrome c biogenesis protein CcsA n=1 Tax=Romeriopsis navalis LEGE 11480 TaxID=2777977 RepID=A0A928VLE5_9CYAN|nr:cytochrome c biogenesis protein CcsA [Romeriopsis navalis]MBE9029787.1 cytochrome c biogenesis protein CcsA [Romeriopsis navalis LEGE 11480]
MKLLKFLIGLCLGALMIVLPVSQFQTSPLEPLQTLAVQLDGRKKPLDTVALETVSKIHGSASYKQADGSKLDYLKTYLSLSFNDRDWNQEPFILFTYRPLKERAGLDAEQKYFSFQTLLKSQGLADVVATAHDKQVNDQDLSRDEREALTIEERVEAMLQTVGQDDLPIVPHPTEKKGKWLSLATANQSYSEDQIAPLAAQHQTLVQTYDAANPDLTPVVQAATALHDGLAQLSPTIYPAMVDLQREVHFHHFHAFAKAWMIYAVAFVAMLLTLWLKSFDLYWGAIGIFCAGIAVNSYGFLLRMQVAGRPPVTNMYESVVWVGFGIAALALLFELTSRARYFLLAAAPLSVLSLVMADRLPAVLDSSIAPLVPVLRDNFWLSIHVPTITLSYASFALALGLGHVALGYTLWAPNQTKRVQALSQLTYRVIQVGVLLLTTGIILGGVWAHVSWGRFWGWDPKETWALIALLCYLIPLHGRLVGWIGNFGINVASIVAFNAVLMAWYGVNFVLGTGLHSYGFTTGGSELTIVTVVGIDLLFVSVASLRYMRSRSKPATVGLEAVAKAATMTISDDVLEVG